MNDARAVRLLERLADLHADFECLLQRQRPFSQTGLQSFALQILHHQERGSILAANIMQHANMRMIQRRNSARLALEPLLGLRILRKMRRQNLDSHGAVEARVARAIHLAHAARSERRLDFIGTKLGARG